MAPTTGSSSPEKQREAQTLLEDEAENFGGQASSQPPAAGIDDGKLGVVGRDVGHKCHRKLVLAGALMGIGLLLAGVVAARVMPQTRGSLSALSPGMTTELVNAKDPCEVGHECGGPKLPAVDDDGDDDGAKKSNCSEPGYDCSKTRCCKWSGMQCYRKHDHWASCKVSCVPGPDLADMNSHPWSCEAVGPRAGGRAPVMKQGLAKWVASTCAKPGENCTASRCCAWAGMRCYTKDEHWATCRPACTAGPDPTDADSRPWECKALGPRTPGDSVVKLEEMKPAAWVAEKCSKPGENCKDTQCCAYEGMQCYGKDKKYATCKVGCVPGPDLTDANSRPWTCEEYGSRTPGTLKISMKPAMAGWVKEKCAKPGQNCKEAGCCAYGGMRCYAKNGHWASCRYFCDGGPDPTDVNNHPWNCSGIGPRTPGKIDYNVGGKAADWVASSCAKPGEDCSEKRCCTEAGMQCFEKNEHWATCRAACSEGPDPYDANPNPWSCRPLGFRTPGPIKARGTNVKVPGWVASTCAQSGKNCLQARCCQGHGEQCYEKNQYWAACMTFCAAGKDGWNCKELGARTPRPWGTPSLYCFSVFQTKGYEPGLMEAQFKRAVGIFACDGYDIATTVPFTLGGVLKALQFVNAAVGMSVDHTAGNAQLFMNVWDTVKARGQYSSMDWTVKVDPDAVMLPDRMRTHVKPITGGKAYIVNCDKPTMTPMMFGSLEMFTKQAIQTYFDNAAKCKTSLQWAQWGEDFYMGKCMDLLGVMKQNDFSIISDGVCKQVNCFDGNAAAFHPFKSTGAWLNCHANTQKR